MTLRVLMVDDEPDAEILFKQNFRREIRKGKYEFLFAQSGQSALEVLRSDEAPSLLLLLSDINMPGMSGIELLQAVKQELPSLPVIMITAYDDLQTQGTVHENGANGLMSKPVDFIALKEKLRNIAQSVPT